MPSIELYRAETSQETAVLAALYAGDLHAVGEGLSRMNRSELRHLGEVCEYLADRAWAQEKSAG